MSVLGKFTLPEKAVILLSVLTLSLGLANLGRAVVAMRYSAHLPGLPTTVPLQYLAVIAGFWGVTFTACTVGLSFFREWGRRCTLITVTLYQVNAWINRLLFVASDHARRTLPRDLALTLTLLLMVWIPLHLPRVREAFERD